MSKSMSKSRTGRDHEAVERVDAVVERLVAELFTIEEGVKDHAAQTRG